MHNSKFDDNRDKFYSHNEDRLSKLNDIGDIFN